MTINKKNNKNREYDEPILPYFDGNNNFGQGLIEFYKYLLNELFYDLDLIDDNTLTAFLEENENYIEEQFNTYNIADIINKIEYYRDYDEMFIVFYNTIYQDNSSNIIDKHLSYDDFINCFIETFIIPLKEFLYKQNYYDYLEMNSYYDND